MIYGDRIRLRHIERSDLPNFVNWINDPEVREPLSIIIPMSLAEEEIWFEASLERDPIMRPFAIEVQEGDEWTHIGSCGFHEVDERARHAEFGIMIGVKEYWNQGLGADATRALMKYGFETLNLQKIYLRVFDFNARAKALYKKLGYVEEGRLRRDCFRKGKYWDTILMGMLHSEWQQQNSQEG